MDDRLTMKTAKFMSLENLYEYDTLHGRIKAERVLYYLKVASVLYEKY